MDGSRGRQATASRPAIRFPDRTTMDEKYIDQIWKSLRIAIQEIQRKNNYGLSFEELYRNAYTMVLHKHGDKLYVGLREVIEEHLRENVRPGVESMVAGRILGKLNDVWTDHTVAMVMIRDILMYMDRVYVNSQRVETVYNLGLSIFRDEVIRFNGINDRLRREILDMIQDERSGQRIDWLSVKHACSMLSALNIYEMEFEQPFLKETADYYRTVGQELLGGNSASEYVQRVEQCISDENDRAQRFLEKETKKKLLDVVDRELITQHMRTVVDMDKSGVVSMLEDNKVDDIRKMYMVFSRVEGGRTVICNAVTRWLRARGDEISNPAMQSEDLKNSPILYISRLMELKDRCDNLFVHAFNKDKDFKNKMHGDFEYFINLNSHASEYLTAFLDDKLRKGNRVLNDSEIDEAVDKAMTLFRFLADKDLFEHFYKRGLAKRLLTDRSVSDDAEKQMVSRLKTECGYQYTQKLELMFKDRELWNTMLNGFREFLQQQAASRDPAEIQMRVLTSGVWPTQNVSTQCRLPLAACTSFETFKDFYARQHNGRKLTLNTYLGSAEVKAIFYNSLRAEDTSQAESDPSGSSTQRVVEVHKILSVSTHQMAVILMFNDRPSYTYEELLLETAMPESELMKTVQSLSMGKAGQRVLLRKGGGGRQIEKTDVFCVNEQFNSKLVRVKISTIAEAKGPTSAAAKEEANIVKEQVADDRKHEIECAIVRIMKSRKRLEHNNLVSEVIYQLSQRFSPTPALIKQRIEALIDRDYLVRDKNSAKIYDYVS